MILCWTRFYCYHWFFHLRYLIISDIKRKKIKRTIYVGIMDMTMRENLFKILQHFHYIYTHLWSTTYILLSTWNCGQWIVCPNAFSRKVFLSHIWIYYKAPFTYYEWKFRDRNKNVHFLYSILWKSRNENKLIMLPILDLEITIKELIMSFSSNKWLISFLCFYFFII